MDEFLTPAPEAPFSAPQYQVIEPRRTDRRQTQQPKKRPQVLEDLKLVFDVHVPFTSRNKKKSKKPKKEHRLDERGGRPHTPICVPEFPQPQQPMGGYPGPGIGPVPPHPHPHPPQPPHGSTVAQPGGHMTPPATLYSSSSTDSSPSPLSPLREHHRPRARSLSLNRSYEERKEAHRERERREYAQRVALAENEARLRAEREAQRLRDERDRERRHNEDLRSREQRRLEDQRRLRTEVAERERRRRSQEERERLAAAIIARRRREELDRRWEAEAILQRERRAEARRRREEAERLQLIQEERDRLARQRRAHIPRGPRHAAVVHHHHHHHHDDERESDDFDHHAREGFEERGDRVINGAIRAERRGQIGRGALHNNAQPGWPPETGLRRRGTIAAGERRVYDDDRRRRGWRWF
ncbi:MAG: hypothetical protein Q9223_002161 [Gallowayella weberi]